MPENTIIIFGLAGAGKSTLARRLGAEFGLRVVHPSGVMRDLLEGREVQADRSRANDGFWETEEGAAILHGRLNEEVPVDVAANNILLQEVERGEVVIDSWSLPWLTDKGTHIHLHAPLKVRAARAAARAGIEHRRALQLIRKKDEDTRQLFSRLYGFDIKNDERDFALTLDTTELTADEVFAVTRDFLLGLTRERKTPSHPE